MRLVFLVAAAVAAHSQTAVAPLSGYIYKADSRTLHAVRGVPGSAYVGPAIADNLDRAWPAPTGAIAVAVRAGETVTLSALDRERSPVEDTGALLSGASMAAWSPSGKAVALLGRGQLQIGRLVEGRIWPETPIETEFLGEVTAVAIDDAGQVAIASADGIYVFASSGGRLLHAAAGIHSLRFGAGGALYAAAPDRLLRVNTDTGAAEVLAQGLSIPYFAVSQRTGALFLVDSNSRALQVYDSSGRNVRTIALDRVPAAIDALVGESLFLLNAPGADGSPAIVLQASEEPAVLFVPSDSSTL